MLCGFVCNDCSKEFETPFNDLCPYCGCEDIVEIVDGECIEETRESEKD